MVRLDGASEAVRTAFRPWAVDPAAAVTAFGGASLLLFALSVWFWVGDRRRIATVVSYAFVALSLVVVLKTLFGLPRPSEGVRAVAVEGDPFGFPSGHAVAAVVAYGGLAAVYERFDRGAVALVAVVVVLIALSRVVLGVHYLGDVVAGTALGLATLAALHRTVGRNPTAGFGVALALAAVAVVLGAPERAFALGGAAGGLVGSLALESLPEPRSALERGALPVVGVPMLVAGTALLDAFDPVAVLALANAALVALIFALPRLVAFVPLPSGDAATSESGG
jgi:membrane-associated phospholipid phosphatase